MRTVSSGFWRAAGAEIEIEVAVACGWAQFPKGARLHHFVGVALLCGIGFTMSLFIGLLAFDSDPTLQTQMKVGIMGGSLVAAVAGALMILAGSRSAKSP